MADPIRLERSVADMPLQQRAAQLVPSTFNGADNTVDVTWTAGSRRRAYDWTRDVEYDEELDVSSTAVDMSRFEAGVVQVLDAHNVRGGVGAILGIATRGSIANGRGTATLKLSTDPSKAGTISDIKAGVIRAISFGYSVEQVEVTRAKERSDGATVDLYRATRWTPQELSFVPIPADMHASTRAQSLHATPCEFIRGVPQDTKANTMTEAELQAQADAESARRAAEMTAATTAAAAVERQRAADITALCTRHKVPAETMSKYLTDGTAIDLVRTAVLDDLAARDLQQGNSPLNVLRVSTVTDETQTRMAGLEEAITHRVDAKAPLTDRGRQFRGMSLIEMGREHLERCSVQTRGMDRMQLATQILNFRSPGMLSTSDFSALLANVATKRLRQGYEENHPSYTMWARRAPDAPDFKPMTIVNLAGAPDLLQVNEHGEFKYGSFTDGKETYSLITYGRIVSLTRQALINDDLRGFDRLVGSFGNSAARLENRTVYSILTANAPLSDGGLLFNSTAVSTPGGHANLTSSGTAISVASLGVGRTMMRLQKGLQSEELNLTPSYLIVPAAQEQIAYQYLSANYVPAVAANVNEFRAGGRTSVEPIVEAILDANSSTAWYLLANTGQIDTVEYCYLQGASGPVIESEVGFEVDGVSYKCRLDFAAKAVDFRGMIKNVGA